MDCSLEKNQQIIAVVRVRTGSSSSVIVTTRLSRMKLTLRREVVEYMSDFDAHLWSMSMSKANFFRLVGVFGSLVSVVKWFGGVCVWTNPITTVLVHILFVILACFRPRAHSANGVPLHFSQRNLELPLPSSLPTAHEHIYIFYFIIFIYFVGN
ncbi:hypothetical protein ZOSMA_691G00030 [Zostera marina]|uniref:Transmembrane protein n=1 Tax=Zostera marina TaxID=29655 RepID=A0A0K9NRK1_ZOSMR|nr:hypothetical protein ZOSMA_691G00030 [Zostera marina]